MKIKIDNTLEQNIQDILDNNGTSIINAIMLAVYPVGSIYMSVNNTNPGTLFGGTWEQIKDTFLLACGDTYKNGESGGEAAHTLTINEMPPHRHLGLLVTGIDTGLKNGGSSGLSLDYTNGSRGSEIYTNATGGGQPHNNMPPYLAVFMWKRTA